MISNAKSVNIFNRISHWILFKQVKQIDEKKMVEGCQIFEKLMTKFGTLLLLGSWSWGFWVLICDWINLKKRFKGKAKRLKLLWNIFLYEKKKLLLRFCVPPMFMIFYDVVFLVMIIAMFHWIKFLLLFFHHKSDTKFEKKVNLRQRKWIFYFFLKIYNFKILFFYI